MALAAARSAVDTSAAPFAFPVGGLIPFLPDGGFDAALAQVGALPRGRTPVVRVVGKGSGTTPIAKLLHKPTV
jgi:hypothetical protein